MFAADDDAAVAVITQYGANTQQARRSLGEADRAHVAESGGTDTALSVTRPEYEVARDLDRCTAGFRKDDASGLLCAPASEFSPLVSA